MKKIKQIISNKVRCMFCNETIESKNIKKFVSCTCGKILIWGAKETLGRKWPKGFPKDRSYEELSEVRF